MLRKKWPSYKVVIIIFIYHFFTNSRTMVYVSVVCLSIGLGLLSGSKCFVDSAKAVDGFAADEEPGNSVGVSGAFTPVSEVREYEETRYFE